MPPHELEESHIQLQELHIQLQELRDRDFAHPSSLQNNAQLFLWIRMITPSSSGTSDLEAVQELKTLSTTVPTLTKPDVTQPLVVSGCKKERSPIDASCAN